MRIPSILKIGGITHSVHVQKDWLGRDDADGMYFCDNEMGNAIYIAASLSREAQEVTLIHEILHALNSTMDHEFLDSLAEQLYQVLRDNQLLK